MCSIRCQSALGAAGDIALGCARILCSAQEAGGVVMLDAAVCLTPRQIGQNAQAHLLE
jgi:hypothetical protein